MIGCKCWSKHWNPLCCRRRSSCVAHCICETLPTVSALLDPKRRRARALFASWKCFETSSIVTHILVVIGNAFMYILLDITVQSHRSHPWREEKWIERSPRKIPRCCQQARNGPGWNQEKEDLVCVVRIKMLWKLLHNVVAIIHDVEDNHDDLGPALCWWALCSWW